MIDRREFLIQASGTLALPALTAACAALIGCTKNSLADWANTIGTETAAIVTELGNTSLAAQLTQATASIVAAINAWKPGTPATVAIQAINLFQGLIALVPATTAYEGLIRICVGAADALLALLPSSAAVASSQAMARDGRVATMAIHPPVQVRDEADFVAQFNAELVAQNISAIKPIKQSSWWSHRL
jgi:hypothetical protein